MPSYQRLLTATLVSFPTANAFATPTPTRDLRLAADLSKRIDKVYGMHIAEDEELPPFQAHDIDLRKHSRPSLASLTA